MAVLQRWTVYETVVVKQDPSGADNERRQCPAPDDPFAMVKGRIERVSWAKRGALDLLGQLHKCIRFHSDHFSLLALNGCLARVPLPVR